MSTKRITDFLVADDEDETVEKFIRSVIDYADSVIDYDIYTDDQIKALSDEINNLIMEDCDLTDSNYAVAVNNIIRQSYEEVS